MIRNISLIVLGFLVFVLAGCTYVRSEVEVSHNLPERGGSFKYAFVKLDDQAESHEYETYKKLVRNELSKWNWHEADRSDAVFALCFGFSIDEDALEASSEPVYSHIGFNAPKVETSSGVYKWDNNFKSTSGGLGRREVPESVGRRLVGETFYTSKLWLRMVDVKDIGNENAERIYEASVKSRSKNDQLARVMPGMIRALFNEFPGVSGESKKVSLPLQ